MKSIRDVYKIGKGPSSSHTMGPERAARLFLSKYPDAETYRVVLYGSLSKTGRGHGTDRVLYEVLGRERTEVVFSEETPHSLPHPNTLDFFACREGKPYATMRVASIGGGDIRIEGQDAPQEQDEVYPENSFAEIAQFCRWRYISLSEYVELNEGPGIWDFLAEVWQTMKQAVADGLAAEGTLPGGLNVERKAKRLYAQSKENERPQVRELRIVCAYAFAVSEQNADNGTIVTAPTCGSAGVLPAVLLYMQRTHNIPDAQVLRARQAQRLHLRRRMRLSGRDRHGLLHGRRRAVRSDGSEHRGDGIRRRDRHGAPPRPDVRPDLRPCPDPVYRAQRRGCQARHGRLQPVRPAVRLAQHQLRHGRAHDEGDRPAHQRKIPRDLRRRPCKAL